MHGQQHTKINLQLPKLTSSKAIPVAGRSKSWVWSRSYAGTVGSDPAGGMDVCCECCVLSGRGLCVWLITRPEVSY